MGLISINGNNPFDGQKDPYLSMDSSIDYNQNPNGSIKNTYTLQGALTGCDKNTLSSLRDDLVRSFDWKEDSTIPQNININGIVSGDESQQIIPTSLDFEQSNYIGSLAYTIKLEVFTGLAEQGAQGESLVNKTHTVTTSVNEKGCVNVSTNISCSPNENLTGCGGIDEANAWIKKQLGVAQVGQVSAQAGYPLQNESLTINPATSEVSYASTHGYNCDQSTPEKDTQDVPGVSDLQIAQCIETNTEQPECGSAISTSRYQGEVYKKGASSDELFGHLKSQILSNHQNIKNLSTQYSSSNDSINFSFEVKEKDGEPVYEPTDEIINDYTVSTSENYDNGSSSLSINGSYKLINPKEKTKDDVLDKDDDEIKSEAESNAGAGGFDLKSKSITRNPQDGTLSYSYGWESPTNPDDENGLQGKDGVYNYSVSINEPLRQYAIVPVLGENCPDYIIDLGYCSKGSISVNVTVESGANANGSSIINNMKGLYGGTDMVVTEDTTNTSSDGTVSMSYSATFNSDNC